VATIENIRRTLAATDVRVTVHGTMEFEVRDPDGYGLWFGQESGQRPTVLE